MKLLFARLCTLCLFIFCASCSGSSQIVPTEQQPAMSLALYPSIEVADDLQVREIQPGMFIATHSFPWPHNSMLVLIGESDLLLVDTPYTPQATRDLLEWAGLKFGKRNIVAINTGFHYDNLGGNAYLIEQGIPVYGSAETAKLLEEKSAGLRAMTLGWLEAPQYKRYYEAHRDLPYEAPTNLFDLHDGLELRVGNEIVQVIFPGASHAPDNVVVYFPARKVLFGGCMILGTEKIGNISDADMSAWPDSVEHLRNLDFRLLIPGHGDRLDPALLDVTVDLLKGNK